MPEMPPDRGFVVLRPGAHLVETGDQSQDIQKMLLRFRLGLRFFWLGLGLRFLRFGLRLGLLFGLGLGQFDICLGWFHRLWRWRCLNHGFGWLGFRHGFRLGLLHGDWLIGRHLGPQHCFKCGRLFGIPVEPHNEKCHQSKVCKHRHCQACLLASVVYWWFQARL